MGWIVVGDVWDISRRVSSADDGDTSDTCGSDVLMSLFLVVIGPKFQHLISEVLTNHLPHMVRKSTMC